MLPNGANALEDNRGLSTLAPKLWPFLESKFHKHFIAMVHMQLNFHVLIRHHFQTWMVAMKHSINFNYLIH